MVLESAQRQNLRLRHARDHFAPARDKPRKTDRPEQWHESPFDRRAWRSHPRSAGCLAADPDLALAVAAEQLDIGIDHQLRQFGEFYLWFPPELALRLGVIANEQLDLRWAEVARINLDMLLPIKAGVVERGLEEFADRMGFVGGDHVIIRFLLLEHEPHRFDVFFGVTPVAFGLEVSEEKLVLQPGFDVSNGAGDFACHKRFAPAGRFMIEENAIARVQ